MLRIVRNNAEKYKQEAVISTLVAAAEMPVTATPTMPADRMAAFRKAVANRLRAANGQLQAEIIVQIASEQAAIAKALVDPKFIEATTAAYAQELTLLSSNIPLAEAKREVESIFKNRVADCKGFVAALGQPDFMNAVVAEAAQPAAEVKPYALPARKIEETVRRLYQPNDPDGAEPAVHTAASARGQQVTHQALANLFRPSGVLRAPLVNALTTASPKMTGEQVQALAGSWLKARHDPAHSIADALKPGGEIYNEAIRRAEAAQNAKLGLTAPAPALAAAAPSPITSAPRVVEGKLQTADLAMDSI